MYPRFSVLIPLLLCTVATSKATALAISEERGDNDYVQDFRRAIEKRASLPCTAQKTCGEIADSAITCFVKPTTGVTNGPRQCSLAVRVTNRNVCQLSLKFDAFTLAQPKKLSPLAAPQCTTDSFTVNPSPPGTPVLCGDNTFQHMFIPVDASSGNAIVTLNVYTANVAASNWKIRITQIDCAAHPEDMAPPGCLQYFGNSTGTIKSFNYNGGKGPYPRNSNYNICVAKSASACSISLRAPTFHLGSLTGSTNFDSPDCDSDSVPPGSHDYLRLPAQMSFSAMDSLYCGNFLENAEVTGLASDPIAMTFNSDNVDGPYGEAFQINYNQSPTC